MRTTYVIRQPVDNRYLVRERDRRRLRELGWVLLIAVPLALAFIGYVSVNHALLRSGYRIHELEGRLSEVRNELAVLELEEAYQSGAARLAERGAALGLGPPGQDRQWWVEGER